MKEMGWDIAGAGYCPVCHWPIDLHPFDAEGVDVGRCPDAEEQMQLRGAHAAFRQLLQGMVRGFPRAPR